MCHSILQVFSRCRCYGTFCLHGADIMPHEKQSIFCRGDFSHNRHNGNYVRGFHMQDYSMGRLRNRHLERYCFMGAHGPQDHRNQQACSH